MLSRNNFSQWPNKQELTFSFAWTSAPPLLVPTLSPYHKRFASTPLKTSPAFPLPAAVSETGRIRSQFKTSNLLPINGYFLGSRYSHEWDPLDVVLRDTALRKKGRRHTELFGIWHSLTRKIPDFDSLIHSNHPGEYQEPGNSNSELGYFE